MQASLQKEKYEEDSFCLIKQKEAGKARHDNHFDGIDLKDLCANEGGNEQEDADAKLPHILAGCREILFVAKQQGGSRQQTHDGRTQTREDGLYRGCAHVFNKELGDDDHQDERRQYQGEGGYKRSQH